MNHKIKLSYKFCRLVILLFIMLSLCSCSNLTFSNRDSSAYNDIKELDNTEITIPESNTIEDEFPEDEFPEGDYIYEKYIYADVDDDGHDERVRVAFKSSQENGSTDNILKAHVQFWVNGAFYEANLGKVPTTNVELYPVVSSGKNDKGGLVAVFREDGMEITPDYMYAFEYYRGIKTLAVPQDYKMSGGFEKYKNINIETDINGDGQPDLVEIYYKKAYISNSREVFEFGLPYVRAVINGVCFEERIASFSPSYTPYVKILAFKSNNGGKNNLAVTFGPIGTGRGINLLYVLEFNEGFKFLPMPQALDYKDSGKLDSGSYGFSGTVFFTDNFKARVVCDETDFTGEISIEVDRFKDCYDENGNVIHPLSGSVDSIYDVKITEKDGFEYLTVYQDIGLTEYKRGIGSLITTVSWQDGEYIVENQQCSSD